MRGIYSYMQVIDSFCACVSLDSERSLSSSLASSSSSSSSSSSGSSSSSNSLGDTPSL